METDFKDDPVFNSLAAHGESRWCCKPTISFAWFAALVDQLSTPAGITREKTA